MAQEPRGGAEADPDRTDTLPILAGVPEPDEPTEPLSGTPAALKAAGFIYGGRLDLPKLAAKLRAVEERVARQAHDYALLANKLERSLQSEAAATDRANALAEELAAIRAAYETERERNRKSERALFEKIAGSERARARREGASAQIAALTAEARTLKAALAARDATILQVLNSLAERDAQLTALQREHASVVPDLEARVQDGERMRTQLEASEARAGALQLELDRRAATIETMSVRSTRAEAELAQAVRELKVLRAQAAGYLEVLQSREWRRAYEHSRWREPDAAPQALQTALIGLESQRDELKRKLAEVAAARPGGAPARASDGTQARDDAAVEVDDAGKLAQIQALKAALQTAQEESAVLLAHLQVARREASEARADREHAADPKQLNLELAARIARVAALEQENRELLSTLERTRGALDEREFLIRRLERSETNNASALGRLQNTIERLDDATPGEPVRGAAGAPQATAPAAQAVDARGSGELDGGGAAQAAPNQGTPGKLVRVDGGRAVTYLLRRRNQVGRAPGTEVHIDSSTVSRLHALIVSAPGGAIIEDVKSTNGTFVNGRRVTRQLLHDGDLLTIGEAQFRFVAETRKSPPIPPGES